MSLTDLGVTPQTVFIVPRTVRVDLKSDLRRLRPLLVESSSRRTSFAGRSAKGIDDPLNEIRKRLASLEPPSRAIDVVSRDEIVAPHDASPSESAISSSVDLTVKPRSGRKLDSKAAAAVAATPTNAVGTTSLHDDPSSGRTTPTAGPSYAFRGQYAPYSSSYEGEDPGVRAFLEQVDLDNYREPLLDFGPRITGNHRKRGPPSNASNPQGVTMIAHLTHHTDAITSIVVSPDQIFFATSSLDMQVLVWDTARLERSISAKPRLSHHMTARITSMCRIENTHCLAVAAEDGHLQVLRVHVTSSGGSAKYGRLECIRSWRADEKDGHVTFVSHLHGEQGSLGHC